MAVTILASKWLENKDVLNIMQLLNDFSSEKVLSLHPTPVKLRNWEGVTHQMAQ